MSLPKYLRPDNEYNDPFKWILNRQKEQEQSDIKYSEDLRNGILWACDEHRAIRCIPKGYIFRRGISKAEFEQWINAVKAKGYEIEHDYLDDSFLLKPIQP